MALTVLASLPGLTPASAGHRTRNTSTGCSGEVPAAPRHLQWVCSFDDEFNGTSLDLTKWTPANSFGTQFTSGPPDSRVCYFNTASTIDESGGFLKLSVGRVPTPFTCGGFTTQYVGGSVSGYGKFSQTYGRFEVRAQFPNVTVAGLQETLWLWPVNDTKYGAHPASGEIDFAEAYSTRSDLNIPYIHYLPATPDPNVTTSNCTIGDLSAFHTYTLVWKSTSLTIAVDGVTCLVDLWNPKSPLAKPAPFDQPFFLALTQALGINSNAFVSGQTPLPATTTIDYARVWRLVAV